VSITIRQRLTAVGDVETADEVEYIGGKTLGDYIGSGDWFVAVNGIVVDRLPCDILVANRETYDVMRIPAGSFDKRENWKALFQIATLSTALYLGPLSAFTMPILVGSGIVSALWPGAPPKEFVDSQAYTWQRKSNEAADANTPMPIVYGKTRVKPVIKNRFVTAENGKQYLHVLYSLTGHVIDQFDIPRWMLGQTYHVGDEVRPLATADEPGRTFVCKKIHVSVPTKTYVNPLGGVNTEYWKVGHGTAKITDILVNNAAIEGYSDIWYETRPGLALQSVIEGFNATYNNLAPDTELYIDYPAPDFVAAAFDAVVVIGLTLYWKKHTIRYKSVVYNILAGSNATPGVDWFIWWGQGDTQYTVVYTNAVVPNKFFIGYWNRAKDKWISAAVTENTTPGATDWFTATLSGSTTHNIQVDVEFPYGLYGLKSDGTINYASAYIFAQYRRIGTTPWTNFPFYANADAFVDGFKLFGNGMLAGVVKRKTTEALFISFKAVPNTSVSWGDGSNTGTESILTEDQYEVRVSAYSPVQVILSNLAAITYGDFSYPGEALIGIKALASGQINGDLEVTAVVERSEVWVNTGTTWAIKPANNHAWAVYDILANGCLNHPANAIGQELAYGSYFSAVYGCGILPSRLDYASFNAWATYLTNTLDYELNIVFDSIMTVWDAILRICQEGRGMVYPIGTTIFAITDKPTDSAQVFSDGNIHVDTFSEQWLPLSGRANAIEATYFDADRNYEKVTMSLKLAAFDTGSDMAEPLSLTLYGTTGRTQAFNTVNFMLKCNEKHIHVVQFDVDIDALDAEVGDVIKVQHSVPQWGEGGRVVEFVTGEITLDKAVTLLMGQFYTLVIVHASGLVETKTFEAYDSFTSATFIVPVSWTENPTQYEVYMFGLSTNVYREYRITSINRTQDMIRTVVALNYDEDVYSLDTVPELGIAPKIAFPTAMGISLKEVISRRSTGEYESAIMATWQTPNGYSGAWDVFFRDVDALDIGWRGEWVMGESYNFLDKVELDGVTYIALGEGITSQPFSVG
jgi:hypothetical protein